MQRYIFVSILLLTSLLYIPVSSEAQDVPDNLTLKEIFHEPVIPGIRPSLHSFSGDQKSILFSWNDSSYYETGLYKIGLDGSDLEEIDDETPRLIHSPNNRRIAYTKDGDLYIANADGSNERKIVATKENEFNPQWSPNGMMLAFVRSGDVWVTHVNRAEIKQITGKEDDEPNFSLDGWAGNNKLIVRQSDFSDAKTIYFPEYLDEFVKPGATTRGIPDITIYLANISDGELDTLTAGVQRSSAAASSSGNYVVVDYADDALKNRKLKVFDTRQDSKSILFEDSTDGWLHGYYMEFAPTAERLLFLSEQSGWNHLYVADLRRNTVEQLTEGDFEITWAAWLENQTIVYASNEVDYGARHIYKMDLADGSTSKLTDREVYRYMFSLGPDRKSLVYAKTYFNEPFDLYMMDMENPGQEVQVTNTVPEIFGDYNWQKEEYVRFTGRDGETDLSMSVLYPQNYDKDRTYPVVVFAHGAGSLQNVYKGWSNNYWREYMFHQYLLLHDYIVVEVDFRHSTGYGRKFREDVTNWMGKYETIDIVDGLDWLQEREGTLDLNRVGIYGGSYGGFMALYAVTDKPDRFHAAAALRKVTNWRNYYHANPWYTLPRLGDPEEHPEHYDRSSPLTYASELIHPIILLRGLIDDNVGAQDAFQYAEELIQSGHEEFEMMIYPSERHGFTSPESWYDEYRRIFEFFEKHLK